MNTAAAVRLEPEKNGWDKEVLQNSETDTSDIRDGMSSATSSGGDCRGVDVKIDNDLVCVHHFWRCSQ